MVDDSPATVARYVLYGEFGARVAADFVHVERIADRSRLYEWTISPHLHPGVFQLVVLTAGKSLLIAEAREIPLDPPCLVAVPCGAIHAFRFAPEAQGWVLSAADAFLEDPGIAGPTLTRLLQGGFARPIALNEAEERALLEAALALLARPAPVGDRTGHFAVALVLSLIDRLAGALAEEPPVAPDRRLALFRRFGAMVEAGFREHRTVADYARMLGTTPQTLRRACDYAVGQAPGGVIKERVMREAMRALAFSTAGIGQVSEELGFADPAYFSRYFKAAAGVEPSRFRRERAWRRFTD